VERLELFPRPTPLPTGMEGWLEVFGQPLLDRLPPASRAAASARVLELLRPALRDEEGNWTADYLRLRLLAKRPAAENHQG